LQLVFLFLFGWGAAGIEEFHTFEFKPTRIVPGTCQSFVDDLGVVMGWTE